MSRETNEKLKALLEEMIGILDDEDGSEEFDELFGSKDSIELPFDEDEFEGMSDSSARAIIDMCAENEKMKDAIDVLIDRCAFYMKLA